MTCYRLFGWQNGLVYIRGVQIELVDFDAN